MALDQFMKALSMLPQIADTIKAMGEEEKRNFIEQLGLQAEEKETAYEIISSFQQGKTIGPEQQKAAYKLLEMALKKSDLDISALFNLKK